MLCCFELVIRLVYYIVFTLLCGALGISSQDGQKKKTTDRLNIFAFWAICFIFALLLPELIASLRFHGCRAYERVKTFIFPTINACIGADSAQQDEVYTADVIDRLSVTFAFASMQLIFVGLLIFVLSFCNYEQLLMNQFSKCAILVPTLFLITKTYLAVKITNQDNQFWSSAIIVSKWYLFVMYVGFDVLSLMLTLLVAFYINDSAEKFTSRMLAHNEEHTGKTRCCVHFVHILTLIMCIAIMAVYCVFEHTEHWLYLLLLCITEAVLLAVIFGAFCLKYYRNTRGKVNSAANDYKKEHAALMAFMLNLFLIVSYAVARLPHREIAKFDIRGQELFKFSMIIANCLLVTLFIMFKLRCGDDDDDESKGPVGTNQPQGTVDGKNIEKTSQKPGKSDEQKSLERKLWSHTSFFFMLALVFGTVFFHAMHATQSGQQKNATFFNSKFLSSITPPSDVKSEEVGLERNEFSRETAQAAKDDNNDDDTLVSQAFDGAFVAFFAFKCLITLVSLCVAISKVIQCGCRSGNYKQIEPEKNVKDGKTSEFTLDSKFMSEFFNSSI